MNEKQKQKQLEMELTNHKDLFLNWDGIEITLKWDNEISNYRGKTEYCDACIWKIETLLEIINGEWKNTFLRSLNEDN